MGSVEASWSILACTEGVRGVGLKMTRLPELSFMRVPRPPILTMPKRLKGVEKVVSLLGRMSRITVLCSVMVGGCCGGGFLEWLCDEVESEGFVDGLGVVVDDVDARRRVFAKIRGKMYCF